MEQPLRARRSFVAPLVTLLATIVLGAGSCFGFLSTLDFNGNGRVHLVLSGFFVIVFCLCAVAFPVTIVWIIVRAVRNAKSRGEGVQ